MVVRAIVGGLVLLVGCGGVAVCVRGSEEVSAGVCDVQKVKWRREKTVAAVAESQLAWAGVICGDMAFCETLVHSRVCRRTMSGRRCGNAPDQHTKIHAQL